ncbi:pyridoxamine 5'-phosphate oxidase family protein [Pseudonocardia sp. CA-107938]|uniref:pyridoxamine 5'-phosphate oxidase family protein n=1 Tax=Pseudonocardia sp. CA-107938 TaxID=3240021 RepID=UPI003D8E1310
MSRAVAFDVMREDVKAVLGRINYATMTTVDGRLRPRSRVLIAVWELDGPQPIGWLGTFRTPVKTAHLAAHPYATFSYWDQRQDTVSFDTGAAWTDDPAERRHAWRLYEQGSPAGVGYPPARFWPDGPDGAAWQVLKLQPYRVQLLLGRELASGVPPRIWRSPAEGVTAAL